MVTISANVSTQLRIAVICTPVNNFKYSYLTVIILFNVNHLFAHSELVSSIAF